MSIYTTIQPYEGNKPYIFISYDSNDTNIVHSIIDDLQRVGYRVWFKTNESSEIIAKKIQDCETVLIFISNASINSQDCRNEINFAIDQKKNPLVIHLEMAELSLGMRLQLNSHQALFKYRHNTYDDFIQELIKTRNIQPCKDSNETTQTSNTSKRQFKNPVKKVLPSHVEGLAIAQYNLAIKYQYGQGVPINYEEAAKLYQKAADVEYDFAQSALGYLYQHGLGVQKDIAEAARLYQLSADQGNYLGQYNLACLCETGNGVPVDHEKAFHYYRLSAKQNYSYALLNLGRCYNLGLGTDFNASLAFHYYQLAANQGLSLAVNNLGTLYEKGVGVPQDYQMAMKYYKQAMDMGFHLGASNLASCYENGKGVAVDLQEALRLYEIAAKLQGG